MNEKQAFEEFQAAMHKFAATDYAFNSDRKPAPTPDATIADIARAYPPLDKYKAAPTERMLDPSALNFYAREWQNNPNTPARHGVTKAIGRTVTDTLDGIEGAVRAAGSDAVGGKNAPAPGTTPMERVLSGMGSLVGMRPGMLPYERLMQAAAPQPQSVPLPFHPRQ